MSSQARSRVYEMSRSKEDMSSYRSSPYSSKSRGEIDGRKRDSYSSAGGGSGSMGEKHREPSYSSKASRRSLDEHKDSYISSSERRDSVSSKRGRDSSRENYSKGARERDYSSDSRIGESYSSRGGRDSFSARGGRGAFSSRGGRESFSSRGGRESFSSRGGRESFSSRGGRESFSSRGGRESFSSRGGRESFSSRGGRESFSSRGGRESFSSRGGRESFSSRGGRESFSSRGGRESFSSRGGRESFSSRGGRESSRGGRESFSSRGGRESFSSRGSYGSTRGGRSSFSSRGGGYGSLRGGRDSFSRGSFGSSRGGRDSYSSRGSYGSPRGGRESFSARSGRGSNRGFRGSHRGSKSENFISHLGPRAQLELTKKLVASVLEDSDGRGHYGEQRPYRIKEFKREGRGFYHRDSDRPYKEASRNFNNHHSPFTRGDKILKRERASSSAHFDKQRFLYSEKSKLRIRDKLRAPQPKRMHDDDDDDDEFDHDEGPPMKHPRLAKRDKFREPSPRSNPDYERRTRSYSPQPRDERPPRKTPKERGGSRGRARSSSKSKEKVRKRSEKESKVQEEEEEEEEESGKRKSGEERDEEEERGKVKIKRKFSSEEDENEYDERRRRETTPSGMQVTIRSDGERAVNSEGHVKSRISGKLFVLFVDLQCPHCPGQRSITFKEYRYHLDSRSHRMRIDKLAYKHSVVLRRIRLQQRNEQREIEEKWEKDSPDEYKTTVSRYCNYCKLAFKCLPEDNSAKGIAEHNESKLHKVQQRYLYPRCTMCRMSFPSRLIYEYHIASIRHLRMRTMCREEGREGSLENTSKEEGNPGDKEEVDLTNFITMDSVGEDEEIGSEQEEITGKLEDIEKAEEDAKEGEEEEEEEEEEGGAEAEAGGGGGGGGEKGRREEPFEADVEEELDHEVDEPNQADDDDDNEREICGKEYVVPIEAFYCKLCHKAVRTDTPLGEEAIDRHCSSALHLDNFHYLGSEEFLEEHGEHFDDEHLGEEEEEEEEERAEEQQQEGEHFNENDDDDDDEPFVEEQSKEVLQEEIEDEHDPEEEDDGEKPDEDLEQEMNVNGK